LTGRTFGTTFSLAIDLKEGKKEKCFHWETAWGTGLVDFFYSLAGSSGLFEVPLAGLRFLWLMAS
jgi:hypothetical protein